MLLKMNPKGDADPFVYLMRLKTSAGKVRSKPPVVIRGNISRFRDLHRLIPFSQKDTRPVLSYHVDDQPTLPEVLLDVDLLNRVAFPGFRDEDHEEVFVLHGQEQQFSKRIRWDVHGVWLRKHLGTGLAHNPYYERSDLHRFDLFKQIVNLARGYEEPAAAEHSRVFGATAKGTKAHELEAVVRQIFDECTITTRDQIADELDRRGYKVKRRRSGEPRGRKSFTVTLPDGTETKLVGDPLMPVNARIVASSDADILQRLESMLEELNGLCLRRARRNWHRYQSKVETMSLAEAEKNGFGFEPITLQQLFPTTDYENRKRRTGLPHRSVPSRNKAGESNVAASASHPGGKNWEDRDPTERDEQTPPGLGKQPSSSQKPSKSVREFAKRGADRDLAESVDQAATAIGALVTRLIRRAKRDLTQPTRKSKKMGS